MRDGKDSSFNDDNCDKTDMRVLFSRSVSLTSKMKLCCKACVAARAKKV